jgi:hypothetical protein
LLRCLAGYDYIGHGTEKKEKICRTFSFNLEWMDMEDKLKLMRLAVAGIASDSGFIYFHLKQKGLGPEDLGLAELDFYRLGLCRVPKDGAGWLAVWSWVSGNKRARV